MAGNGAIGCPERHQLDADGMVRLQRRLLAELKLHGLVQVLADVYFADALRHE